MSAASVHREIQQRSEATLSQGETKRFRVRSLLTDARETHQHVCRPR